MPADTIEAAREAITSSELHFRALPKNSSMAEFLEAAKQVELAQRKLQSLEAAKVAAEFALKNEERLALSQTLHDQTKAAFGDISQYTAVGINGLTVSFNKDDGSVAVNVITVGAPRKTTNTTRIPGTGGTQKPRALWTYQGNTYTTRELLTTFGGEAGAKAVYEATEGYKTKITKDGKPATSPGFDTEVKRLARSLGWNDNADRIIG